jgi:aldose 1-epimerase
LHGGFEGFNQKIWNAEIISEETPKVCFSCESKDGEMGYPGNMTLSVTFTVTDDNILRLEYSATSDKDTVANFTNHAYFNPNGINGGDATTLNLQVNADKITATDDCLIPYDYMDVQDTPFDFRTLSKIGDRLDSEHQQIKLVGGGIDHNFVLGMTKEYRHASTLKSDETGIEIKCYTDMPGVQIYTSNFLGCDLGKGGKGLYKHQGVCMETQFFPDSPNHKEYPSCVLKAGDTFKTVTEYHFSK